MASRVTFFSLPGAEELREAGGLEVSECTLRVLALLAGNRAHQHSHPALGHLCRLRSGEEHQGTAPVIPSVGDLDGGCAPQKLCSL